MSADTAMPGEAVTVLSCLTSAAPASLANHRHYAFAHGYRHELLDMACGPCGPQIQALQRYEHLLATLARLPEAALVLLLGENAAVVHPVPLPALMRGRDCLLVLTSGPTPQPNVQVWRNTATSRAQLAALAGRCRLGSEPFPGESALLAGLPSQPWHQTIDGICPVMSTGPNVEPRWSLVPTFAVSLDASTHSPPELGIVPRFRETLFSHINDCQLHARQPLRLDTPHAMPASTRQTFNPGRPVALVTLYTPGIACYGRLAEASFRHYCQRHGHTLHVYRDIPAELGLQGSGNWFKPWLLHAWLAHHEWVLWLDADVLVADPARPIEPLLDGRDCLLARDIGQWPFNSGIMGFRRTPATLALLADLMARIAAMPDRSGVYTANGDQFHFIAAMREHGLLQHTPIDSPLLFNTPWFMRSASSFLVHYFGMWTQMRALMMHADLLALLP
ncbi:galactosyl transferase GMA12/MNN10 domain protein [Paraburkholderia kururiensis]|uniref:galactosyl transferase GMA12/MNN10 domain protein n=1 Tax=Paraburkholderia kururiensis TaxID=984307 RepID=UPI001F0BAEA1|nr:galactosyl transferase GMA12/MNN10 domain protein [Paraburkholderia kururiensis]